MFNETGVVSHKVGSRQQMKHKQEASMTAITPFSFENHPIRTTTDENGEPLFVAKDVCEVLEIANVSQACSRLDTDEKGVVLTDTLGGTQELMAVTESGLYALIFRSRKEEARRFRKWVTSEVLPAIRKTGSYSIPAPTPAPPPLQIDGPLERALYISSLALHAAKAFGFEDNQAKLSADNAVRNITGVSPLELMGQKALIAPSKDQLLTVSDVAKRIGVGPMKVNPLLIEMGLQVAHRDHKNRIYYEITEKGETHAEVLDTGKRSNSGTPIKQIKWKTSVLDLLTNHLETTRDA